MAKGVTLASLRADLERMERHVDEAVHALAVESAGIAMEELVRAVLLAPELIQQLRQDLVDGIEVEMEAKEARERLEDLALASAYAIGGIDGKNAEARGRQERAVLESSVEFQQRQQEYLAAWRAKEEAERRLELEQNLFRARLAVLGYARSEMEWLSKV